MVSINFNDTLNDAIINGNYMMIEDIIKNSIKEFDDVKDNLSSIKKMLDIVRHALKGLNIEGYKGDFPTFIEPVFLTPGVEIGDTVLLGPNVFIGKECKLGDFCELSNTILLNEVTLGKYCKLNKCIINQQVNLSPKFEAKEAYISKKKNGEIEIFYF